MKLIRKLVPVLAALFCINAMAGDPQRVELFSKESYAILTFATLREKAAQYSGECVAVTGYLGRDYDWNDTERISAFYSVPLTEKYALPKDARKISIDPVYADELLKLDRSKTCTIYGVCISQTLKMDNSVVIKWIRIDRIECADGTRVDSKFEIEKH